MANGEFRVFISAVTSEFGAARDEIANDLNARGIQVRVQRSFRQEADADTLLCKLHNYISGCSAVICVIGNRTGACPTPDEADEFRNVLPPGFNEASYTQWEFFIARHYGKRLSIYLASDLFVPERPVPTTEDYPHLQEKFVKHIEKLGLDHTPFSNAEELRISILKEDWPKPPVIRPIKLPYQSMRSLFKGRSHFMQQLSDSLPLSHEPVIITKALYGLGGIGKSRAALEYAWEHQNKYSALLLVTSQTPEALRRELAALTIPLGLPERGSMDDEVKLLAVLNWLRANPIWLLILDGLDTEQALDEAVHLMGQMTGGHVVITSQLTNFPPSIEPLELKLLDIEPATQFLIERTRRRRPEPDDQTVARELAERLDGLALALEQAAAFINEKQWTFRKYIDEWHNSWLEVADWSKPAVTQYPRALVASWQTSVARLSENARRLLQSLSWFSSEPIPEFMLDVSMMGLDAKNLWDSLNELSSLSLVTRHVENSFFSVHRLVQTTTRLSLGQQCRESLEEAVCWMDAAFTGDPTDVKNWPRLDPLWPHALAIAEHAQLAQITSAGRLTNVLTLLLTTKTRHAQREIELGCSPRVWLPPMTKLRFSHTRFEMALEPLQGLSSLQELSLTGIYVGDAAPLAKLVNLQRLDLGRTQVISIAPLANLKALRRLDLRRTKVGDIAPIAALTDLESLALAHTLVTDISPLASLTKLQSLDLSDIPITDITKLAGLSNLTRLGLGGTHVRDISALVGLTRLSSLDLSDTRVTDLSPLTSLRTLEELRLNGAKVRHVPALANLTKLRDLDLSGTKVCEISPLADLVNLYVLSLGGCAVENVTPLAHLVNLKVLNLGCTRIKDIKALTRLVNLRSLDLRGTRVRDTQAIAELFALESVDLAFTKVMKVSPLAALPRLKVLHLEGTRVSDTTMLISNHGPKILQEV
jgi:Leucine-rich repeat (LRR) protein